MTEPAVVDTPPSPGRAGVKALSPWAQVLSNARKAQTTEQNGTVAILGTRGSGKGTLIRTLQSYAAGGIERIDRDQMYNNSDALLLDAAFLPVRAASDITADYNAQTCACLMIHTKNNVSILQDALLRQWSRQGGGLGASTILINVRLSDMLQAYEEVEMWLGVAAELVPQTLSKGQAENTPNVNNILEEFGKLRAEKAKLMNAEDGDCVNPGVDIVVCGTHCDQLPSCTLDPAREALNDEAIFTCYLRNICRKYGATLTFVTANDEEDANIGKLYSILTSKMLKDTQSQLEYVAAPANRLLIPAFHDRKEDLLKLTQKIGIQDFASPLQTIIKARLSAVTALNLSQQAASQKVPVPPSLKEFLSKLVAENESLLSAESPKQMKVRLSVGVKDEAPSSSRAGDVTERRRGEKTERRSVGDKTDRRSTGEKSERKSLGDKTDRRSTIGEGSDRKSGTGDKRESSSLRGLLEQQVKAHQK